MGRTPTNYPQPDDEFQEDLHPEFEAGVNAGPRRSQQLEILISAADIKQVYEWLPDFTDADLKQILVLPLGERLQQGAVYLDLADPTRRPFTAMGGEVADLDHYYVPKDEVDYVLWNRLIGVTNRARLDRADDNPAENPAANPAENT
jgi:hypothetical protein